MLFFLLCTLVAVTCLYYVYSAITNKNAPPVVQYGPIPYLSTLLKYREAPQELIAWAYKTYGPVFTVSIFGLMNLNFVCSDEGLELFFKAKEEKLSLGDAAQQFVSFLRDKKPKDEQGKKKEVMGKNSLDWIRESITTDNYLKIMHEKIVDQVQQHVAKWEKMDKIALVDAVTKLVVSINIRCFVSDDGMEYIDEITKLYQIIEDNGTSTTAVFLPWSAARKRAVEARRAMQGIIEKIMAKRIAFVKDHPDEKPLDVLQININSGKDAADITSNLISIFFAAHVNTVSTNIWTILHLAQDSKWQDQLVGEFEALGSTDFEAVKRMETLGNMIKETVRLHALVQMMRQVREPVTMHGYTLPTKSYYMISPLVLHLDEKTYAEPNTWNPDRFKGKNYGYRFIQWGFGPHRCLGEHFAYLVIRSLIATIFSKYRVALAEPSKPLPKPLYSKLLGMAPPSEEVYIALQKK